MSPNTVYCQIFIFKGKKLVKYRHLCLTLTAFQIIQNMVGDYK